MACAKNLVELAASRALGHDAVMRLEQELTTTGGLCAAAFAPNGQRLALGEWGGGRVLSLEAKGTSWEGALMAEGADEEDAGVASVVCVDDSGRVAAFAMSAHTGATGLDGLFLVDLVRKAVVELPFPAPPLAMRFTPTRQLLIVTNDRVGSLSAKGRVRWLRSDWAGSLAVDRVLDCSPTGDVTFTVRKGAQRELWRSAKSRRKLATVTGDVRGVSADGRTAFLRDEKGLRFVTLKTGRAQLHRFPAGLGALEVHAISSDGARAVVAPAVGASDKAWLLAI